MYMQNNPYQNQQWTPMQQQNTLPPGWEAKWDPGSKRWFYINHITKITQWDAPLHQSQNVYHGSQPNNTTSFIEADPDKVKTLRSEYKDLPAQLSESMLRIHQNDLTAARKSIEQKGYQKKASARPHHVSLLKQNYPTASLDIIRDVLADTNNNVGGARLALNAMGFKRGQGTATTTKPTALPKNAPKTRTTPAKKSTPAKFELVTKKPKELSDKVKKQRIATLKKKYPKVDEKLIVLFLETVSYDTELASAVLESSIESEDRKKSKPLDNNKDTPAETESYAPKSLEPVVFGAEDKKKEEPPINTQKPPASSSTMSSLRQPTTSQSTNREKRTPVYATVVKRVVPMKNTYSSSSRQCAVGPNPNICNGPNPDLLITSLIVQMGPNRAIRNGPQLGNRCGPLPSNAVGPAGIAVGRACYETAC